MAGGPTFSGIEIANLRAMFFAEARDLLAVLESGLIELERRPDSRDLLDDVFRAAHSLKGGARTLGFNAVGELTHALETILDAWREGELRAEPSHVDAMLSTLDLVRASLEAEHRGQPAPEVNATRDRLLALAVTPAPSRAPEARPQQAPPRASAKTEPELARVPDAPPEANDAPTYAITFAPHAEGALQGPDPLLVLRELRSLSSRYEISLDDADVPSLDALDAERSHFRWSIRLIPCPGIGEEELRSAFSFVEDIADIDLRVQAASAPEKANEAESAVASEGATAAVPPPSAAVALGMDSSTLRVATGKVDKIVDLVGELLIAQSAVREYVRTFSPEKLIALQEAVSVSERYLRELQERVMGIRMISVGTVLARLPRMVRELGGELGKEVRLEIQGAETELDKGLAEQLGDPLLHLVRNALDHGLETPEERVRAGKPAAGTLMIAAHARGGSVFVEVSDDGRGLDRERVRAKAVERGLVPKDAVLSDQEVFSLVCSPGFSTAETVTQVSGRGVGLDVVRRNVQAIGGELTVQSPPGRGARFEIRLPLTLTILDGLLIRAGTETCILPLTDVAFSLQIKPEQWQRLAGTVPILHLRGETLPAVELRQILRSPSPLGEPATPPLAVVVQAGAFRYALLVDGLLGQSQIVVKSLETHFRRVSGVMGATILGDGRVALILDGQAIAGIAGVRRKSDKTFTGEPTEAMAS